LTDLSGITFRLSHGKETLTRFLPSPRSGAFGPGGSSPTPAVTVGGGIISTLVKLSVTMVTESDNLSMDDPRVSLSETEFAVYQAAHTLLDSRRWPWAVTPMEIANETSLPLGMVYDALRQATVNGWAHTDAFSNVRSVSVVGSRLSPAS
jgi:hypothetical protein